jgi:hypothetical protein
MIWGCLHNTILQRKFGLLVEVIHLDGVGVEVHPIEGNNGLNTDKENINVNSLTVDHHPYLSITSGRSS